MSPPFNEDAELRNRVEGRINAWRIDVERLAETKSSILVFGRRENQTIVVKVIKKGGDEWRSGGIIEAFGGSGVVRVLDHVAGAMLLERLIPGHSLAGVSVGGADDEATRVLAATIRKMSPRTPPEDVPTARDWGRGFERYMAAGDSAIPKDLLSGAHHVYRELCETQENARLLHGDLHHYNVLYDSRRGWLAIDPKGVVAEVEFEIGAALRNPYEREDLFTDLSIIRRRAEHFERELDTNTERVLAWGFAQSVLSAIWAWEDGLPIDPGHGCMALARTLWSMHR
jgi:streptomycin 6-kinase